MPPTAAPAVRCPRCGHEADATLDFCTQCGTELRGIGGYSRTLAADVSSAIIAQRYRILERIGEGGMGAVFKVEHIRMGKVMAVKLLRPELSKMRSAVERFEQEAKIVSRLSSAHTISVFDFGETADGALFIAMEYISGRDLSFVLHSEGALPEARVAGIGMQLLLSLAEAHDAGIVHRDIKPANVMLVRTRDQRDLIKLLDFGIAKLKVAGSKTGSGSITAIGDFVGTPEYLSPEQARGEELDARSDLYSLGALLYELCGGFPVFAGPTPLAVVSQHLMQPPVPLGQRVPCSSQFEAVLMRALEKRPEDRFPTADAMRQALAPLVDQTPSTQFTSPGTTGDLDIASRTDWDQFESSLRRGIWLRNAIALAALLGLVVAIGLAVRWGGHRLHLVGGEESEPNDRANQANAIQSGQPIRGHIGARFSEAESDKDFYRLEVSGDEVLRAEVTGLPQMALVLDLFGPEQRTPLARADYGQVGDGEILPNWSVSAGTYFIEVHAKVTPGQLPPEDVSDWYRLTVRAEPRPPGEEREPNDTPETASPATLTQAAFGYAGDRGEQDFWALDPLSSEVATEGQRIGAVLSPVPHASLRLNAGDLTASPGNALWVREQVGHPKREVRVRVLQGHNLTDRYALAFFTERADGGRAVVGAIKELLSRGRKEDARALLDAAIKLAPSAAWKGQAEALFPGG